MFNNLWVVYTLNFSYDCLHCVYDKDLYNLALISIISFTAGIVTNWCRTIDKHSHHPILAI